MFTRTRYQNGSLRVVRRENGSEVWEFRFYETDGKGERGRKSLTVGDTGRYRSKSAARASAIVQATLLRINSEQPLAHVGPPNFAAVIARYEQEELPEAYSTQVSYKSMIKVHIQPRWGALPIDRIKPMAVEHWLKELALAPKTKSHIRTLMHTICSCAERWELIAKNPIRLVRVKGGSKRIRQPRVMTPQEFALLPPRLSEPYRTMVWVAGCLGLRASEILALQWNDFDFDEGTVLITRGVVHGRVGDTKTEYSKDRLPLHPELIKILREHKGRTVETLEGWVFPNPKTRRPYHQDSIQQDHIRKAVREAGLGDGIGWKDFRHSYRSWLGDTDTPVTVQKELMRHASIQTTMNVYGKALNDSKRQANSKIVEMIKPKTGDFATEQTPVEAIGS